MEDFVKPLNERWLDVGCGQDKIHGAVGVDLCDLPGVDIIHNLNQYPWPFEDNSFDHVVCNHSLSHLDNFMRALGEIQRIAKPGAIIEIIAPHYASDNSNTDPTLRTRVGIRTMNYFCEQYDFKYHYYSPIRFFMVQRRISFRENITDFRKHIKTNPFCWIGLEFLINAFPRIYERFFVYWLPPSEVYFKLKVMKGALLPGNLG
jgi:SAM-dependent methyltransferase